MPRYHFALSWPLLILAAGATLKLPCTLAQEPSEPRDPLAAARSALRGIDFPEAIHLLDPVLRQGDSDVADEATYLKALAHFYLKEHTQAVETADLLLGRGSDSAWFDKARFLKAQALVALRKFDAAEQIYQEEAQRLLSDERKRELAGVIISLADELATIPGANEVGAADPDFDKAYKLYGKALEMEIGRDLRDDVMFRRAVAILRAKNFGQAVSELRAYLQEFDPKDSRDPHASPDTTSTTGLPSRSPGNHILEARVHLVEALLGAQDLRAARVEAEDLLAALSDESTDAARRDDLRAQTRWLLIGTYQMPSPAAPELEQAVAVTRSFLAENPTHPRAVQAAWYVAEAFRTHGRADQAIAQYERLIAGDAVSLPPGDQAGKPLADVGKSPAQLLSELRKRALFQIGQLRFDQREYDVAIEVFTRYINEYPNGPDWSTCQRGVVDAQFQAALTAVAERKYPAATKLFEVFLEAHPLDERAAQILYLFGQIELADAQQLKEDQADSAEVRAAFERAIRRWQRLLTKYPNTEPSSLALFNIGRVYEEQLGDLEAALQSYRQLTWGSWASQAQARIAVMSQKHLAVSTPRTFRTNEPVVVKVNTRNIEKLTFKQYFLDLEAYFRKTHAVGRIDNLDIDLIQPDKTWEVATDGYAKYVPLEREVEIPFDANQPGVAIVHVSDEHFEATTLVIRSDLELIMKSSRREVLVFVQDMLKSLPAEGVKLLISDGNQVLATGTTGADGVFRGTYPELKDAGEASVFALAGGSVASNRLDLADLKFGQGLMPKGYLYTDRPAYQPGQTVKFRGILRDVKQDAYVAPQGETYEISIRDGAGRLLHEEPVTLNEFGTFASEFVLVDDAPVGTYQLSASQPRGATYSASFQVQQFKLEKLKLSLQSDRPVYFRGEEVELSMEAAYYWGQPAADKPIRYVLPDGRQFTESTDAEGKLRVKFDTSGMPPGAPLQFAASIEGENVTAAHTALLATTGFKIAVRPSRPIVLSGEPVEIQITTTAPDGNPVGREVTLLALRRAEQPANPVLANVPWLDLTAQPALELTVLQRTLSTDEKTGTVTIQLTDAALEPGGIYILRVSGEDRFGQVVSRQASVRVSADDDATKLRLFSDTDTFQVGRDASVQLHSRVEAKLALVTLEGETILSHRIMPLAKGFNTLQIPVDHQHFPNFRLAVALMDGRRLRSVAKPFRVERKLNVAVRPLADTYAPGELGQAELTVTDQLGRPVRAELSLALVDEALFAVYPDTTPDVLEFFQKDAYRHGKFRQASTCGFYYQAHTRPVSQVALEERERLLWEDVAAQQAGQLTESLGELRDQVQSRSLGRLVEAAAPNQAARESNLGMAADGRLGDADAYFGRGGMGGVGGYGGERADQPPQSQAAAAGTQWSALGRSTLGKESSGPQPPRQELAAAGFWAAAITTNEHGKATVEIPLPESTSQWRLTSRGTTAESLVGEGTANCLTRRDFFVTLKTPQSLQEGDSLQVVAQVHNLTDQTGPVDLTLRVLGGDDLASRLAERTARTEISAQGVAEAVFDAVTIPAAARLALEVEARSGQRSDALRQTLAIRPWGMEFASHAGGTSQGDKTAYLELPPGRDYQSRWMTVAVGPHLERSLICLALRDWTAIPLPRVVGVQGATQSTRMLPPPEWGTQPGSELLAVASVLRYAEAAGAPRQDRERLGKQGRTLVSSLVVAQQKDGGWSWQAGGDTADWAVCSLNVWALSEARRAGLTVPTEVYDRARTHLGNLFTSLAQTDNDAKAVVLHALSTAEAADFAHVNRLYRERNNLRSAAVAYTALTLGNLGRDDHAGEMLDVLLGQSEVADGLRSWPGTQGHPWLDDRIETTAVSTLALMKSRPTSPEIAEAIAYLLDRKGVWGFVPAKAHGPAVAALAHYYRQGKHAASDYRLQIVVNGQGVATLTTRDAQPVQLVEIPSEVLRTGRNQVDFRVDGRGEYSYGISLRGFSSTLKDPQSWRYPHVRRRTYLHAPLEYRGRPIGASSTSPVTNIAIGQRVMVRVDVMEHHDRTMYTVIEEPLPAGTMLVEGSLSGQFDDYTVQDNRILMFYRAGRPVADFRYELVGYAAGNYRALPTVIRDAMRPDQLRLGLPGELRVLPPGEESSDPYQMNDPERFALGKLHFEDGQYRQAVGFLAPLFSNQRRYQEQHVARMLLWIYTSAEFYDARQIVAAFEVLRERFPTLEIPYDKILTVGRAYRDIGELERAYQVYRATINASFINDSNVSAVLEDEGQFLRSIDYQEDLWREYPDTAEVTAAYFAISQSLYQHAPQAHELAAETRRRTNPSDDSEPSPPPTRVDLLRETIRLLSNFLALYPENPLADDAAFSLANALLDLKQYELVVEACAQYRERFTKSDLHSGFQYMIALGHFWQRQHEQALAAARVVAESDSKDRDLARYIIGQIYHAENQPANAIDWYRKVAEVYADAQQAIDYFQRKHVTLEEVSLFKPGANVELKLRYRNIAEVRCQVYRVDLMRLYLREKNLANVTKVNLAGIAPLVETTLALGDGKDYLDKDRTIPLSLPDEGAYLVICRGDDLFTSALVLVTPLEVQVQEDATSGRVRANVINAHSGQYVPEVHVKAIGSADSEFRSGETDLRGIFVADRIHGKATVIAREGEARYAFYRGDTWLGAPESGERQQAPPNAPAEGEQNFDYQQNLREGNSVIQQKNLDFYDQLRRGKNRGVEVQKAQ
jgi:uncharacterized protein YfaS (alpha-2-macroglobulin family)/tetratricopeptide (TPR) repeat protein